MDFGHWLSSATGRRPDRIAVEAPGASLTYRELLLRAVRAAGALHLRSVSRGGRVAVALEPGVPFAEALHACLLLGAAAMPVDPRLGPAERARVLRDVDLVVEQPLGGGGVFAIPAPPDGGDTALVVHTSGTTGDPVPIELTYGNIAANTRGVQQALGLGDDERWLCPLPLTHVGGLMCLLRSAIMATTVVLAPPPFDAEAVAAQLRDGGITVASLVPTQLQKLLDAGATPGPALRRILLGGGPMPRPLLERARDAGFPVCASYGLTQACSTVTVSEPGDLETAGRALRGVGVAIAPDGEIRVSGPTVNRLGGLRTGDVGRLEPDGRLVVTGRKGELIITGGENVAPAEVEAVLVAHPAVADAAVVGRADALWGEAVTAFVVPRPGVRLDAAQLHRHCTARLAPFKVPKSFELVSALPRTASGKVRRIDLR